jgi:uncharacterized surface protein with fasciclin (FAS1) repeats
MVHDAARRPDRVPAAAHLGGRIMLKQTCIATLALGLVLGTATTTGAGTHGAARPAQRHDIVRVASDAGTFTTLVTAVKRAGLAGTLKGPGPFTVFAPTDAAFAKLPPGALDALLKDKEALKRVLLHHVVPGKKTAADVLASATLETAAGLTLRVSAGPPPTVGGAGIAAVDVAASNGVIHVIDTVLLP